MPTNARNNSTSGTALAHAYEGAGSGDFYSPESSIFDSSVEKIAFFAMTKVRTNVSSGDKSLNEDITFKLRRAGHLLMGMVVVIQLKGICAYSASPAAGVPNTNGWLENSADAVYQPYLCDYAGLALLSTAELEVSTLNFLSLTNDAMLELEELFAAPGKSAARFMGKHSSDIAPEDAAKIGQTFIIPIPFYFAGMSECALPSTVVGYHGAHLKCSIGSLSSILRVSSATEEEAGTSSSSSPLYGPSGFQVFVRPDGVAWGGAIPTVVATDSSVVRDIYLLTTAVYLSKSVAAKLVSGSRKMNIPHFTTQSTKLHYATQPSADIKGYQFPLTAAKKRVASICVFARQQGADFADLSCGVYPEAPTIVRPIITGAALKVDDSYVYDHSHEEAKLVQYEHLPRQSQLPMMFISFAMSPADVVVNGARGLHRANDVVLELDVNKEAFSSSVTYVDLVAVIQYFTTIELRKGMLYASQ